MIKRILIGVLVALMAIIAGGALYVYLMIEDRPLAAQSTMDFECQFAQVEACQNSEQWLINNYDNYPAPSISAHVSIDGVSVWRGVIGYADLSEERSATFDTQYQIGSISKSLTATTAMAMHQNDVLNINDNFQEYVPDFASEHSPYTIKQLLSHQAGIRHYKDELSESLSDVAYIDTRAAAAIVENDPLLFIPGESFNYSSYAYSLIALAMESTAKATYPEIMQNYLLAPLDMPSTQLNTLSFSDEQARPYLLMGNSLFHAPKIDYSNKYAGAGYLSTPSDLVKFGRALLTNSLLDEASTNLLFTPVPLKNGEMNPQNYALGFRVDQIDGQTVYHHGGTINGGYSFLAIFPEQNAVVAFSMNAVPQDFARLQNSHELLKYFLQK
jgi:CubicO group peptidase (beta-lactamase class C family)